MKLWHTRPTCFLRKEVEDLGKQESTGQEAVHLTKEEMNLLITLGQKCADYDLLVQHLRDCEDCLYLFTRYWILFRLGVGSALRPKPAQRVTVESLGGPLATLIKDTLDRPVGPCLEGEEVMDFAERGKDCPKYAQYMKHVASCNVCWEALKEYNSTLFLKAKLDSKLTSSEN